jgi:gas vesicle protein
MGEDPAAIREQIEETRERMGDTVDALGYKADVPARAKDSIGDKVQGVKAKLTGTALQVSEATPDVQDAKQAGKQAVGLVQENPLGLAIGAAAVGFVAGMLIPSTRVEDERFGQVSDQVKEQAKETGQEAIEHGKEIAEETAQTAGQRVQEAAADIRDKAQETTQQHAQELGESAKDSAQQVQETAKSSTQR